MTPINRRCLVSCLLAIGLQLVGNRVPASEFLDAESIGVRYGVGDGHSNRFFHQVEAFGTWLFPWSPDCDSGWQLRSALELSAGWITDRETDAALGSVGPVVRFGHEAIPVHLQAGLSPAGLSRSNFYSKDLGSHIQFISHLGLQVEVARDWRLGYRFQHMSNAGLAETNPGLNMHVAALSYLW